MNLGLLQQAVNGMKQNLEAAITTATFSGEDYENGQKAKEALIRSQGLIFPIHEVVKVSLAQELQTRDRRFEIHPPQGVTTPELKIAGFIKAKDQDLVILFDGDTAVPEIIQNGPLTGENDFVGRRQWPETDPANAGIRDQFRLNQFPPAGGNGTSPTPPTPPATTPKP